MEILAYVFMCHTPVTPVFQPPGTVADYLILHKRYHIIVVVVETQGSIVGQ